MSWAYNQIDIFFMTQDIPLDITTVENDRYWNKASDFGIVRSRPALTPSSLTGTSTSIPGRNGTIYPSSATRGNAKLQFDILIENSWVHNIEDDGTVMSRADILMALIRDTKTISYKMPGVEPNFYLKTTRKIDVTIANLDKDGIVVQATMEIKPFKYWFTGNAHITIEPETAAEIPITYPNGICKPLLRFNTAGMGYINFMGNSQVIVADISQIVPGTILDTEECLCYVVGANDKPISQNSKFKGDYRELWLPKLSTDRIDGGRSQGNWTITEPLWQNIGQIYYYTKAGVDL